MGRKIRFRKRGRPAKTAEGSYTRQVQVRFTPDQFAAIEADAAPLGKTVAGWVREQALRALAAKTDVG